MKKIIILSALFGIFTTPTIAAKDYYNPNGGCKLQNPETEERCDGDDNEVLLVAGMGCYVCEEFYCGTGHILAVQGSAKIRGVGGENYTDAIFMCERKGGWKDDKWVKLDNIPWCKGSESRKNDPNTVRKLVNINKGTTYDITKDAAVSVTSSSDVCFDYVCKDGYTRIDGKGVCVLLNGQCTDKNGKKHSTGDSIYNQNCASANADNTTVSKLTSTSNIKSDGLCKLTCVSDGWSITLNDDACVDKYQPNSTKKQCVKTQAAINDDNAAAARRRNCIDSGGTWTNNQCACAANKNLTKANNGTCTCVAGYTYITPSNKAQGCKPTDIETLRQVCNTASDATWNEIEKRCVCNAGDDYFFNTSTKKCEPTLDYAKCQALSSIATWDSINKECRCKDPNKELNADKTECIETSESKAIRETIEITQRTKGIYSQLVSIHDKFRDKKSVWKDAEGNFNTARLASDSIAGVVLGTAGGLITSHVVKKNQVENGFEDIKCTIGGQNVAEWGDQFRVGIQ